MEFICRKKRRRFHHQIQIAYDTCAMFRITAYTPCDIRNIPNRVNEADSRVYLF